MAPASLYVAVRRQKATPCREGDTDTMPEIQFAKQIRFYFIVDCEADLCVERQVEIALAAGATVVQYRNKRFEGRDFGSVEAIRRLCAAQQVPFIVNDDIVLARAVGADGVHLGQSDEKHAPARKVLGQYAIIGASVSTVEELGETDLTGCDYIGTGPVFETGTKADANPVIGPSGLARITKCSPVPVVAIGGIDWQNAHECFAAGASGIAVISAITRAKDPAYAARELGRACALAPRTPRTPWKDEFGLIAKALEVGGAGSDAPAIRVPPGDDAALFADIPNPVFTTDTQREGVHFRRRWQSMEEIGQRAVEITFSDLAASYARPVGFFVNLCLPPEITEQDVIDLYRGIGGALAAHGAGLGGGNLSSGPVLSLDLFAAGSGGGLFPVRSAAVPGDGLYVTGPIGLARCGLECLAKGDHSHPALIERYKLPRARFDAARVLRDHDVACVMDISDGLYGDASHIAEASGTTVCFEPDHFVIDRHMAAYCVAYGIDPAARMISGGDDYELLFACPPERFEAMHHLLSGAFRVGSVTERQDRPCTGAPGGVASYRHGNP